MATLAGFKAYAVENDCSDGEMQLFLDAAKEWFANAGVPEPMDVSPLYDLGVYRLATYYMDNRGPQLEGRMPDAVPYGIQGIALQLKQTKAPEVE